MIETEDITNANIRPSFTSNSMKGHVNYSLLLLYCIVIYMVMYFCMGDILHTTIALRIDYKH